MHDHLARLVAVTSLLLFAGACGGSSEGPDGFSGRTLEVDAGPTVIGSDGGSGDDSPRPELGPHCRNDLDCHDGNSCNGEERCVRGACLSGSAPAAGTECDLDRNPTTADVCSHGYCVPSRCGDGLVDPHNGEECDDANHAPGDGCDGCRFECVRDVDCGDCGFCDLESHACKPAPDSRQCNGGDGRCIEGVCLPKQCESNGECDDGDPCNGLEFCGGGRCLPGDPAMCNDGSSCTEDVCRPDEGGCVSYLWDADLDGHAPASMGACGSDCDDTVPRVHEGASELCDDLDNDCDGAVDEGQMITWYVDCDGDGWASSGARAVEACDRPSGARTGCSAPAASWTRRVPLFRPEADCNDHDPRVRPGQSDYFMEPIDDDMSYDYDCSGVDEGLLSETVGSCETYPGSSSCAMHEGWVGAAPQCGEAGLRLSGCRFVIAPSGEPACVEIPNTTARVQSCH